jgi:hypothetical protein
MTCTDGVEYSLHFACPTQFDEQSLLDAIRKSALRSEVKPQIDVRPTTIVCSDGPVWVLCVHGPSELAWFGIRRKAAAALDEWLAGVGGKRW